MARGRGSADTPVDKNPPAAPPGVLSTSAQLTVPPGATVDSALVTIRAAPAGPTPLSVFAQVRDAPADSSGSGTRRVIVDLQGLRTLTGLSTKGFTIKKVWTWQGTQFPDPSSVPNGSPAISEGTDLRLLDLQTEKLLVEIDGSGDSAQFAKKTTATLASPPADLAIDLNGRRVFFQGGPVRAETDGAPAGDFFRKRIDLSAEVLAAAAGAKTGTITVDFKSSAPGILGLDVSGVGFLSSHAVTFPEGEARTVVAPAEGPATLLLPLPAEAATWTLHALGLIADAKISDARVEPPDGPAVLPDAELVIDAERTVLAGLPAAALAKLETLTAIRLPVYTGGDGAELAGALCADAAGEPGAPLTTASMPPLAIDATPRSGDARWLTLALGAPLKLTPGQPLWLALQVSRGQIVWPLGVASGIPLRRGLPGGPYVPFPIVASLAAGGFTGLLRLVGKAPNDAPIASLDLAVAGASTSVTATANGTPATLRWSTPVRPGAAFAGGALAVQLVVHVGGTYKFRSVQVVYKK